MKVAVVCNSLLLRKSLEIFLRDRLSSQSGCDFVVSDRVLEIDKPVFLISRDKDTNLAKPFSKTRLVKALDEYYKSIGGIIEEEKVVFVEQPESTVANDDEMEQKIRKLTDDFVSGLMHVFREYR